MTGMKRWRETNLERAVETAGGRDAFDAAVAEMLAREFRDLQAYGQRKLAERGYADDDVVWLVLQAVEQLRDQDLLARARHAAELSDATGVLTYDGTDLAELRAL